MYDAVLAHILTDHDDAAPAREPGPVPALVALRAIAPELDMLSAAERQLLADWLDRAVDVLQRSGR